MFLTIVVTGALLFAVWQLASVPVAPDSEVLRENLDFASRELQTMKSRLDRLQARQAVLVQETEVLRKANRILKEGERERQAELGRLQSELDFYRMLAGSGDSLSGLDVYRVEIVPTDSRQVFQYIFTLTQNIQRASVISGSVRIGLEGTLNDRPVALPWEQVSDGQTAEPEFMFKYFQQIEGYLTLPGGFSPIRLQLTLETKNRRTPVVRHFDWARLLGD